jgi:uncharacterized membrane protein YdjX (TVP38/TMEM64 family)
MASVKLPEQRFLTRKVIIVTVLLVAVTVMFYSKMDVAAWQAKAEGLSWWLILLLMAVLPVVGFPASFLYVVAGASFGGFWGLLLASLSIVFNLLITYGLTSSYLYRPIMNLLQRAHYRVPQVPESEYVSVTFLIALVPSAPYTVKNYALPLAGVPLKIYFWVCLPVHIFNASLAIFFGDLFGNFTPGRIIFLASYGAVNIGLCYYVARRLYARKRQATELVAKEK